MAKYFKNHLGHQMIYIPGGEFVMGDIYGDGASNERPLQKVKVKSFSISDKLVTNKQIIKFLNSNYEKPVADPIINPYLSEIVRLKNSYFDLDSSSNMLSQLNLSPNRNGGTEGLFNLKPKFPIEHVDGSFTLFKNRSKFHEELPIGTSWFIANLYCDWLSRATGEIYRLPTEPEWEYAARSGGKNEKWSGTNSEYNLSDYAWFNNDKMNLGMRLGKSPYKEIAVGLKKPNGLGIYDMSGLVSEWCYNQYFGDYSCSTSDGYPKYVTRGGCCQFDSMGVRCFSRSYVTGGTTSEFDVYGSSFKSPIGFRVCKQER